MLCPFPLLLQTNPHVIDFVRDGSEGRGSGEDPLGVKGAGLGDQAAAVLPGRTFFGPHSRVLRLLRSCEKFLQADISHRLRRVAKLKIIPKVYGQEFGNVIGGEQTYRGTVNVVPRIPFLMRFKALTHPCK